MPTSATDLLGIFFLNCPDIVGVLELKEETIESLLAAACLLQLSQVIQVCCNFLMKQLHPSNCLGIRSFADAQGCVDLLNVAHNYTMVRTLKEPGPVCGRVDGIIYFLVTLSHTSAAVFTESFNSIKYVNIHFN